MFEWGGCIGMEKTEHMLSIFEVLGPISSTKGGKREKFFSLIRDQSQGTEDTARVGECLSGRKLRVELLIVKLT